jgi:DsbC/DsbD-like thiol-disulfide interchange protein
MKHLFRLCLAALIALPFGAAAEDYANVVSARVLPGWIQPDGSRIAGLEITLAPGWKTYWRAPGDAGIPPVFDWSASRNTSVPNVVWPTPKVFDQNGMRSIGYTDRVVLPILLRATEATRPVRLKAEIDIGVCRDVCMPQTLSVSGEIPAGPGVRDAAIAAAIADTPFSAREAGVRNVSCRLSPGTQGIDVVATVTLPTTGGTEHVVIETDNPMIWVSETETRRNGDRLEARATMAHVEGGSFAVNREGLRLTVLGKSHAVDIQGCPAG